MRQSLERLKQWLIDNEPLVRLGFRTVVVAILLAGWLELRAIHHDMPYIQSANDLLEIIQGDIRILRRKLAP